MGATLADAQHQILVFTDPVEGREDEYNTWYDDIHVSEVLAVEGFVACQRFATDPSRNPPAKYLAVYEVDAEDPVEAWKTLQRTIPQMNMSDSLDMSSVHTWIYTALGERVSVS